MRGVGATTTTTTTTTTNASSRETTYATADAARRIGSETRRGHRVKTMRRCLG